MAAPKHVGGLTGPESELLMRHVERGAAWGQKARRCKVTWSDNCRTLRRARVVPDPLCARHAHGVAARKCSGKREQPEADRTDHVLWDTAAAWLGIAAAVARFRCRSCGVDPAALGSGLLDAGLGARLGAVGGGGCRR